MSCPRPQNRAATPLTAKEFFDEHDKKGEYISDASFLLTVEAFLAYGSSFFNYGGGTVSKKYHVQFLDGGEQ